MLQFLSYGDSHPTILPQSGGRDLEESSLHIGKEKRQEKKKKSKKRNQKKTRFRSTTIITEILVRYQLWLDP
jgi:hypothetical protein